jgi:hypothetical protein
MMIQVSDVTESVRRIGWCCLGPMSDAEYRTLVGQLGTPWCETAVELRPNVRSYLCKPEPVPFHTDHPDADWMSWRCEVQDEADGTQLLVDGLDALRACGPRVRDVLTQVHVEVRVRQDTPPARVPIVRVSPQGDRLFFASWIKPMESDPFSLKAFAALREEIDRRCESHAFEVRLAEGEVLVIDNGRLLHGRKGLASSSKRRLRRFWITREGSEAR